MTATGKTTTVLGTIAATLMFCGCSSAPTTQPTDAYRQQVARSSVQDAAISHSIRQRLETTSEFAGGTGAIEIQCERGEVNLSGAAKGEEIRRAMKIALSTPGVRMVRNDIQVQGDDAVERIAQIPLD